MITNSQRQPAAAARGNQLPADTVLALGQDTPRSPASAHTLQVTAADATAGFDLQPRRAKAKGTMRRRARLLFIATAAVLGALVITGCGPATSGTSGAQQLIQQFPWLSALGASFIQGLLAQFGSNLIALLAAAAAALGL